MFVKSVRLRNFRSFVDTGVIDFARINVLIGANNAGKSSVLKGLGMLQDGNYSIFPDVRVGTQQSDIEILLSGDQRPLSWPFHDSSNPFGCSINIFSEDRRSGNYSLSFFQAFEHSRPSASRLSNYEPYHFVVPYLSKRKSVAYHEDVSEKYAFGVAQDVGFLAAKLSRIGNPAYPAHASYADACKQILGFVVSAIPSQNGMRPGVYLPNGQQIGIEQLGEGVPNIVHLLISLSESRGKLFLIEEPENDLHPKALKALLDLILKSSAHNQFVISTHSNIVVRHLCSAADSSLFNVRVRSDLWPIESEIDKVSDSPPDRLAVLEDLGYSLSDYDLWDGWLILEESSAERIIRDYLIPWFYPRLSRVRTISAGGVSKVPVLFEEMSRFFLFTHLTPMYQNASWVLVDGDDVGRAVVEKLRSKFPVYPDDRISFLDAPAFEYYYPKFFSDKVKTVLSIEDEKVRRSQKAALLQEVIRWLDSDVERGRCELMNSAKSVIEFLARVESSLS